MLSLEMSGTWNLQLNKHICGLDLDGKDRVKYTFKVGYCNYETIVEMEKWCMKHLYHGGYYEPLWHYDNNNFIFENEQEFIWFKLRWQ